MLSLYSLWSVKEEGIGMDHWWMGRDSAVGIATRNGLDGPGIESRWGTRFSVHVQTGPGSYPAPYAMGRGSLQGVNGRGVALTTHPI
jgi:hypothetical protein